MAIFSAIVQAAVAVYLIYGAITGRNKVLELRYPKKGKAPQFRKLARIIFGAAGGLLLVMAVINFLGMVLPEGHAALTPLGTVLLVLSFVVLTGLLALLVLRMVMTDREAQKRSIGRSTAPRAAFFFDEEGK